MMIQNIDDLKSVVKPIINKVLGRWRTDDDGEKMATLILELIILAYQLGSRTGKFSGSGSSTFTQNPCNTKVETRPLSEDENSMIEDFLATH